MSFCFCFLCCCCSGGDDAGSSLLLIFDDVDGPLHNFGTTERLAERKVVMGGRLRVACHSMEEEMIGFYI